MIDTLPAPTERRTLRELCGLSQAQLAANIGCAASSLGNWESGAHEPRGRNARDYAAALAKLKASLDTAE